MRVHGVNGQYNQNFMASVKLKGEYGEKIPELFEKQTAQYPDMVLIQSHVAPTHKDEFTLVNKAENKQFGVGHRKFTSEKLLNPDDWTDEKGVKILTEVFDEILKKSS